MVRREHNHGGREAEGWPGARGKPLGPAAMPEINGRGGPGVSPPLDKSPRTLRAVYPEAISSRSKHEPKECQSSPVIPARKGLEWGKRRDAGGNRAVD